jgi:hypothetical protein
MSLLKVQLPMTTAETATATARFENGRDTTDFATGLVQIGATILEFIVAQTNLVEAPPLHHGNPSNFLCARIARFPRLF